MSKKKKVSKQEKASKKKRDSKRKKLRSRNSDHKLRFNSPTFICKEISDYLLSFITPDMVSQSTSDITQKLRERKLPVYMLVALALSMLLCQVPSVTELTRMVILGTPLLWITGGFYITLEALRKRFRVVPADIFANLLRQVIEGVSKNKSKADYGCMGRLAKKFSAVWIIDASTLESLLKKSKLTRNIKNSVLGGKLFMAIDAVRKIPTYFDYNEKSSANEKTFIEKLKPHLKKYQLLIMDRGFNSFPFYDWCTKNNIFFITRLCKHITYKVCKTMSSGHIVDQIIKCGLNRSHPCKYKLRLITFRFKGQDYIYLTNVLNPDVLFPNEVMFLYQKRWRIETMFFMVKKVLGLSFLHFSNSNAIMIQTWSTLIIYTVLINLNEEVAQAINVPVDEISFEMVFRALFHFAVAAQKKMASNLVLYLVQNAKTLNIVKRKRKKKKSKIPIFFLS